MNIFAAVIGLGIWWFAIRGFKVTFFPSSRRSLADKQLQNDLEKLFTTHV